ncbi:MAG: TIGR00730 family Rossman fold protein [Planctomycetota bacterium]
MPLSVAVYCSSSAASESAFGDLGDAVGHALARRGHTLVYGGGAVGLMGRVARAVHAEGGHVIGVIPEAMKTVEVAYHAADELIVTQTMRERKHIMDERADAFLILPGGFGTLEELAEVVTHRYLKFHDKPIVILNADGFYDHLLGLFEHFIETGMAKEVYREMYVVTESLDVAIDSLSNFQRVDGST